jgi:hypothetical protein
MRYAARGITMTGTTMASAPVNPPLVARVKKGRLVLDVPTDLPEGAEVMLHRADEFGDDLTAGQRDQLIEEIREARRQYEDGEVVDGEAFKAKLRARLSS